MVLPASRRIPRVLRYSGAGSPFDPFVYGTVTLSGGAFQPSSTKVSCAFCRSTTPVSKLTGLASFPFARRYLGNHSLFSFPTGTEMFQFPACPPARLWIHLAVTEHCLRRVSPFGHSRINTCLRFPVTFRSWPRPSSAYGAWASTLCSY